MFIILVVTNCIYLKWLFFVAKWRTSMQKGPRQSHEPFYFCANGTEMG